MDKDSKAQTDCEDRRAMVPVLRRSEDFFRATGPGGFSVESKGKVTTFVAVLLVMVGVVVYFMIEHDKNVQLALARLENAIERSNKVSESVIYILSKPQDERERLNLSKPSLIREMEKRGY